jgi:hypothetical protein
MLFHVGCLWRLNEAGLLGTIKRVSTFLEAPLRRASWA